MAAALRGVVRFCPGRSFDGEAVRQAPTRLRRGRQAGFLSSRFAAHPTATPVGRTMNGYSRSTPVRTPTWIDQPPGTRSSRDEVIRREFAVTEVDAYKTAAWSTARAALEALPRSSR